MIPSLASSRLVQEHVEEQQMLGQLDFVAKAMVPILRRKMGPDLRPRDTYLLLPV